MNGFELVVSHGHLHQRIQLIGFFMHELLPVTKQVTQKPFPPWRRIDRLASAVVDDTDLFLIADPHRHISDSARYGLGSSRSQRTMREVNETCQKSLTVTKGCSGGRIGGTGIR